MINLEDFLDEEYPKEVNLLENEMYCLKSRIFMFMYDRALSSMGAFDQWSLHETFCNEKIINVKNAIRQLIEENKLREEIIVYENGNENKLYSLKPLNTGG